MCDISRNKEVKVYKSGNKTSEEEFTLGTDANGKMIWKQILDNWLWRYG